MSRPSLFGSPLFLGFEDFERAFERLSKSAGDGFPPYNVEQHADGRLRIVLAVAGFSFEDLSVQVEGNQLVIRGRQNDEEARNLLHRGIASRQFQRAFVLADGIEVQGASLEAGLLSINLERPPLDNRVRRIEIATPDTE